MSHPVTLYSPPSSDICLTSREALDYVIHSREGSRGVLNDDISCASHCRGTLSSVCICWIEATVGWAQLSAYWWWARVVSLVHLCEALCQGSEAKPALWLGRFLKEAVSWVEIFIQEKLWAGPAPITLEDSRLRLRTISFSGVYHREEIPQCSFFLSWSCGSTFWQGWDLRNSQEGQRCVKILQSYHWRHSFPGHASFPTFVRLTRVRAQNSVVDLSCQTWTREISGKSTSILWHLGHLQVCPQGSLYTALQRSFQAWGRESSNHD